MEVKVIAWSFTQGVTELYVDLSGPWRAKRFHRLTLKLILILSFLICILKHEITTIQQTEEGISDLIIALY